MVVGQTGSGKTTTLNSLVNYHIGINISDTFRYVFVDENTNKSQSSSQTDHVTEHHLKANGDRPDLIIIDTPGLGDTKDTDDRTISQIKKLFDTKLDHIHAVCFVA